MKTLAYLGLFFLLSACASVYGQDYPDWETAVQQNRTLWESQHITHYRMLVVLPHSSSSYGSLPMPLTVEVKDGVVISVVDADSKMILPTDYADASYYYQNFFTIPGLFSYTGQYYLKKPPAMRVTFDQVLGYPNSIYIDPWREPCCQDFTITVQNFQILP